MSNTPIPPFPQNNVYGPITPSQMLERTAALLRKNFKLFLGIAFLPIAVEFFILLILGGAGFLTAKSLIGSTPTQLAAVFLPALVVGVAIILVVAVIMLGALFVAAGARMANVSITIGQSYSRAAEKFGRLIGIALLILVRVIGYALLFGLVVTSVVLALGALVPPLRSAVFLGANSGHGTLATVGVAILLFIAAAALYLMFWFWLYARYALAIPAALAENLSVTDSIRRSIHLSKGSRGRLYALLLTVFCIDLALFAVLIPLELMVFRGTMLHPAATTGTLLGFRALVDIFQVVVSIIITAVVGVGTAICYYDLRVRKEGFGNSPAVQVSQPPAPIWPPAPTVPAEDFPIS